MKTKVLSLSALLLVFGFAGAVIAADDAAKPATDAGQILKKLDIDKDGSVNKTEAEAMKGLSEVFDTADANKDGKLDTAELGKAVSGTK